MGIVDNEAAKSHDFDAISPSAYALLVMKGDTSIPFAREAAALLKQAGSEQHKNVPNFGVNTVDYWTRVMHFGSRYWSIDQLLHDRLSGNQPYTNILELSSGFSFRGLALSRRQPVFYIDTDLEGVIAGKQRFVDALTTGSGAGVVEGPMGDALTAGVTGELAARGAEGGAAQWAESGDMPAGGAGSGVVGGAAAGHYELQALNVLDATAFRRVVARFPPGPIAIVNEGLLVYLDAAEKELLCQNIRETLLDRRGCWITADIYLQRPATDPVVVESDSYRQWQAQHKIEEKKFKDIQEAEAFFKRMGFAVDKEAKPNYDRLSALARLREVGNTTALDWRRQPGRPRLHMTWRLEAAF
jgi:hypothetical protein